MFNSARLRRRNFYDELMNTLLRQPMQQVDSAITVGVSGLNFFFCEQMDDLFQFNGLFLTAVNRSSFEFLFLLNKVFRSGDENYQTNVMESIVSPFL